MAERSVSVPLDEIQQVYSLLVEYQQFFHQPLHYNEQTEVLQFLQDGAYRRLSDAVYTTVWNWLPEDVKSKIIAGA
jgi:hypothetical protein